MSPQNEELPWERKERMQNLVDQEGKDLPFPVYLLGSAIVAIAAVGFSCCSSVPDCFMVAICALQISVVQPATFERLQ